MADEEQVRILKKGVEAWNDWREQAPDIRVNLSGANLSGADLFRANLTEANLSEANLGEATLSEADLSGANLQWANLSGANLRGAAFGDANLGGANLGGANLTEANLGGADLSEAIFFWANLSGANLTEANLSEATLSETIISNVDLSSCKNLDSIRHSGPSSIDIRTLQRSGRLPLPFLRGVGLQDMLIDYLPSLLNQAIQHYSCFISYSSKDEAFVRRLHAQGCSTLNT
jgi:hypothetical protein